MKSQVTHPVSVTQPGFVKFPPAGKPGTVVELLSIFQIDINDRETSERLLVSFCQSVPCPIAEVVRAKSCLVHVHQHGSRSLNAYRPGRFLQRAIRIRQHSVPENGESQL